MIGNPVSMPRVIQLVQRYDEIAGRKLVHFVQVSEQEIMDWHLNANRNGHISCTHGGECLAGLIRAAGAGLVTEAETAIVDSTAHALKFSGFQEQYFENGLSEGYEIQSNPALINMPQYVRPKELEQVPAPGQPLTGDAFERFVRKVTQAIADELTLTPKTGK
jgi:threonine synthase